MHSYQLHLNNQRLELHGEKLLWIPDLRLLCASDIHFEKGSFFSRFATFLPPYDTETTLLGLEQAVARFRPRVFVALGDSFHDKAAVSRLQPGHLARLRQLIASVPEWVWIVGNHDPQIAGSINGLRRENAEYNGLCFRHEADMRSAAAEISGHYHPKSRITLAGSRISAPCFVQYGQKLIMPSFGSYTGGLDISDAAFDIFASEDRKVFLTHRNHVFPVKLESRETIKEC